MNDLPEGFTPIETPSHIDESRRRRRRKILIPSGKAERALYVGEIARRLIPGVEFFVFSFTAGLVITLAILLDSPAFYFLGALLAPFMVPVIGLGFSTAVGSLGFFLRSIGALLIGSGLVFATGALGGWISKFFTTLPFSFATRFADFSVPDFVLLTIGAALAIYMTVRVPKSRSLVASVPLAYEIYIPIVVAGFGLTNGTLGIFPESLKVAAVHIAWVILVGTLVLAILKLRPFTFFGYILTAIILAAAVYTMVISSAIGVALQSQVNGFATKSPNMPTRIDNTPVSATFTLAIPTPEKPQPTETPALPTNTLAPTRTSTPTITPSPSMIWAMVYSPTLQGVRVRVSPGYDGEYLTSVMNEELVQVFPEEPAYVDGTYWLHVLLPDGREGWMLRSLLQTATPAPSW